MDYFAGTGVVSRLAKSLGYGVIANDWEEYTKIINKTFLENCEDDRTLFKQEGGLQKVLDALNTLKQYRVKDGYISRYYCPASDMRPDVEVERLFYTRQNGILIDNIRAAIEKQFPRETAGKQHDFLLSLLLYEASKRANTSGVFKGFHKGFGGKKQDALKRILSPVCLSVPVLSKQNRRSKVFQVDALALVKKLKQMEADIVYLDPPYNQHQYGSNYHLLNTITRNDKPKVHKEFWFHGKKVHKSAIRHDWVKTKSTFCVKHQATQDFQTLIQHVRAKYLLISYSTEGIIDFDTMLGLLAKKGKVGIVSTSYTRYRGGRQSQ